MQNHFIYDYAIIRIVPKVEREEFINAGVILSCPDKQFLEAKINLNEKRLKAFAPWVDLEFVKTHLNAIQIIATGIDAGEIGKLSQRERFHWLTSAKSTIIQTSPVHTGYCENPVEVLNHLVENMVDINEH
ncbi:MAG TPA: DUF3037 domain-containing protein [Ignavibacteriaceae bacterium]|nr:DUF3037 domain-containing protein [Ignavibacteriaceae bacterium]